MGAVSFAVGAEGATYKAGDGTEHQLTGWTLGAIAQHERFLEQRAVDAIARQKLPNDQRAAAHAALAKEIACFALSFGGEVFDKSLRGFDGLAHFFYQLGKEAGLTQAKAAELVKADPAGLLEAVYAADPTNRATAENPKTGEAT
jgi:hypothetical protein